MNSELYIAPKLDHPERLSNHLIDKFSLIPTRKGIKKAIKKGWVTIDGKTSYTSDYINGGEHIELIIDDGRYPEVEDLHLDVLLEDEHLAVINKPSGVTVSGNQNRNIVNALPKCLLASTQLDSTPRPQPVHRLDHPTSGALLIGKTRSSIRVLNQMFEDRQINKKYIAICIGALDLTGTVSTSIDGQEAMTRYKVVDTVASERFGQLNLVELSPTTGRKHQLRVHMASIGNPIFGDQLYGQQGLILKGKGLYLHAASLGFVHPITETSMMVESPMPSKFLKIFPNYESKYCSLRL